MQLRTHNSVQEKRGYYYAYWYFCAHEDCKAGVIYDERYRTWDNNAAGRHLRKKLAMRRKKAARLSRLGRRRERSCFQQPGPPPTKPLQLSETPEQVRHGHKATMITRRA